MGKSKKTGLHATRKFIRGTLVCREAGPLSDEQLAKLDPETTGELIAAGLLEGDAEAAAAEEPGEPGGNGEPTE